jgi:hypothetical protein
MYAKGMNEEEAGVWLDEVLSASPTNGSSKKKSAAKAVATA